MTHDCVVIGAGPGGSAAALELARGGARVLLLEKQRLGRDKPCGGGLTPRSYADLGVPISDLIAATTPEAVVRLGARFSVRIGFAAAPVLMVRRRDFDRRLAEACADAGADVHDGEAARAVEVADGQGVTVTTAASRYSAPVLLVATGAEAPLRSALGFAAPTGRMAPAIELEGPAVAGRLDGRAFVLDYAVPHGYAWAFPKGESWNAGVVSAHPAAGPQLRRYLARFLDEHAIRFDEAELTAERAAGRRIPMWTGRRPLQRGRVALVGDAAGLADPFFGEGIAAALHSGRLAARATLDVLSGQAPDLTGYDVAVSRLVAPHLARMRLLSRAVYPAPRLAVRALTAIRPVRRIAAHLATEGFRAA